MSETKDERARRLAEELRANLKRRKAQSRGRAQEDKVETPRPPGAPKASDEPCP